MAITNLDDIKDLPTLPAIVQEIQKLLQDPNTTISQLAALISKDQAITSRVIHLVNSAFYGFRENISSIHHAVVLLGLNTIKNLVMGVSVVKMFQDADAKVAMNHKKFWMHSLACAMGAKLLAEKLNRSEQDNYFLSGLLCDMGLLVIDQFFHDEFKELLTSEKLKDEGFLKLESSTLGSSHGEVGAYLAQKWRMPDFITHTMLHHHFPVNLGADFKSSQDIINVVYLADSISHEIEAFQYLPNYQPMTDPTILKDISLTQTEVNEIFDQVQSEVKDLAIQWGIN